MRRYVFWYHHERGTLVNSFIYHAKTLGEAYELFQVDYPEPKYCLIRVDCLGA